MAIETDADRLAFFSPEDFGSTAVLTVEGETDPRPAIAGIYDAVHLTRGVNQSNGYDKHAEVSGDKPVFQARTSDVVGVKSGRANISIFDEAGVKIGDFTVHDVKADGTGLTILKLMKA